MAFARLFGGAKGDNPIVATVLEQDDCLACRAGLIVESELRWIIRQGE
jgi:hypothetical protein